MRLEPLGPAVLDPYWAFLGDAEGRRLTGTHAEFTRDQAATWLATRGDQRDRVDWAAIRTTDGAFLGEAVITDLDPVNESASYRIALSGPGVLGRGHGTEITRMVVAHALDTVGLYRLSLEVYDHNPRAHRVYTKCGFREEGRLRGALLWEGQRHDAVLMSILRTDPRPLG
ncbi:GNAT family protein [Geodermatophilus sp. DSM 44513]|uniref:GNAT family N-acetyltransferase n=1 Tax=Geodermatophilus sp. DSM 44513 TaxID=1528104 RepID=UPI0028F71F46|nr:GNAT family protein [Geodermatophilus sp. DSM 44513]WNV73849.1 GNAT family protein [Geodermatophilus sp. DSM 44513]